MALGGKADKDESIEETAIRELHEESHVLVNISDINYHGCINYDEPANNWKIHIYTVTDFQGDDPKETEEMIPQWFLYDEIPWEEMWKNDAIWLPEVLNAKSVEGHVIHDKVGNIITKTFTYT